MEEEVADRTAAINSGDIPKDSPELSKNALKKAAKQEKLAADKANKSATNTTKETGKADAKKGSTTSKNPKKKIEGAQLIGITSAKEDDFSAWYQEVLLKGDFIDYYDVSGCYILQPNSYSIWEKVQNWFNPRIEELGVENCSFPMFVSQEVLEKEKEHIEGFAAEVAWVTHAGNSKLDKKIAIRPTSETVIYPCE